ncbi:polysaccharide deacetylase family protein [Microlunatus phosphovorus]|nr:polysaccharide deacetylase family protein [Microlunatus phosphovorus]
MYHAVAEELDPLMVQVTPRRLRQQMATLKRLGYRGVSMEQLLAEHDAESRLVGLTFDDGYADFAERAAPILDEFGFNATVFVVAGHVGGINDWDSPPVRRLMDASDIRAMQQAGHEIGSHGVSHTAMSKICNEEVDTELKLSKSMLETITGHSVKGFCYPYGAVSAHALSEVTRHYDYACAVSSPLPANQWAIPRFFVGEEDGPSRLLAKIALRRLRERRNHGEL